MGARGPPGRCDGGALHMGAAGGKGGGNCTAGAKLCSNKAKGSLAH